MQKNYPLLMATLLGIGLFFSSSFLVQAQSNSTTFVPDEEVELLYTWSDESLIGSFCEICGFNVYNEIWGFVQNGREYGLIGTTAGVNIFDLSDPQNIEMVAFVAGSYQGEGVIHRDFHDYNGYLYMVCDEGIGSSTLQIIDLQNLPESVDVVYDSSDLFSTTHNIFVDTTTAKLYVCAPAHEDNTRTSLEVYYLGVDPTDPLFLYAYNDVAWVHDLYVRNDTAYLNVGDTGLFIVDFSSPTGPQAISALTDYTSYGQGYNHSGWLNPAGDVYAFADETHGVKVKLLDVSDLSDLRVLATLGSEESEISIAHNLIIKDDYLYVSYYHDGLQIFDISDPNNPQKVRTYDTFSGDHANNYLGAWGVYPHLPSGLVLISDMQSGFYVFDANLPNQEAVGISDLPINANEEVSIASQVFQNELYIDFKVNQADEVNIELFDLTGKRLFSEERNVQNEAINNRITIKTASLPKGYLISKVQTATGIYTAKVLNM